MNFNVFTRATLTVADSVHTARRNETRQLRRVGVHSAV